MYTGIKICGVTRPEDAAVAAHLGASAIGLVFVDNSPRCVSVTQAVEIAEAVPAGVAVIGLFLDAGHDRVERVLNDVALDALQFHGHEPPQFCNRFRMPYIKTIGVADKNDADANVQRYNDAHALLFDSHGQGEAGGTGITADWHRLPDSGGKRVWLAGGLNRGNVFDAVRIARPYGVDVSSGVESRPGIKDHSKIETFIKEVRRADAGT